MFLILQFSWLEKERKKQFKSYHLIPPAIKILSFFIVIRNEKKRLSVSYDYGFFQSPPYYSNPPPPTRLLVFNVFPTNPTTPSPGY